MSDPEALLLEIDQLVASGDRALDGGDYHTARRSFEALVELLEANGFEHSGEALACMSKLGNIYYAEGDLKKARGLYSKLVLASVALLGEKHRDVISQMFMLAKICDELGDHEDAAALYSRVLTLADRFLKSNDPLKERIQTAYAASGASTTTLRQTMTLKADDIRTLAQQTQSAPDATLPAKLLKTDQFTASVVCSLVLIIGAVVWVLSLMSGSTSTDMTSIAKIEQGSARTFNSTDGSISIQLLQPPEGVVITDTEKIPFKYLSVEPSLSSISNVLEGMFAPRESWVALDGTELTFDDGHSLYTNDSPEFRTIEQMTTLVASLNDRYQKKKSYPSKIDDWKKFHDVTWINPATKKPTDPSLVTFSQYTGNEIIFGGAKSEEDIRLFLASGQRWYKEPEPSPCAINCCAVFSGAKLGDDYVADRFYMHGYDRNGRVLRGSRPGRYFYYVLHKGAATQASTDLMPVKTKVLEALANSRIYVYPKHASLLGIFPLRLYSAFLWFTSIATLFLLWLLFDARRRLEKPRALPSLIEMLTCAFILAWIGTSIVRLISN